MARRNSRTVFSGWPSWRYGPNGESAIFSCEADVPEGWTHKPGEPTPTYIPRGSTALDRDKLFEELTARGIEINPTWGVAHMKKVLDS